MTTAITILCEETMKAAANIIIINNLDIDAGWVTDELKRVINTNLDKVMAEWKQATEARIGEGWLWAMIRTQAHELAKEALKDSL